MVHFALEFVHVLDIGDVAFGSEAGGDNQESSLNGTAVGGLDGPLGGLLVEFAGVDDGFKCCVFAEVADFIDVIEIGLQFLPVGVVSGESPGFIDFWDVELVDRYWAVDSSSRVAVPSPVIVYQYWV